MARKEHQDRGLLSKLDATGKPLWYVRLMHEGKERRFGSFPTKTKARQFYEKASYQKKTVTVTVTGKETEVRNDT